MNHSERETDSLNLFTIFRLNITSPLLKTPEKDFHPLKLVLGEQHWLRGEYQTEVLNLIPQPKRRTD